MGECPCDNDTPKGEEICTDCLDAVRERDRKATYSDYPTYLDEEAEDIW